MKFFKFDNTALNLNEIGSFPQADSLNNKVGFNIWEIEEREASIGELLIPPEPIMNKKAKFTTFLSIAAINSTHYLVMTNSFFKFLKNFVICESEIWPMRIFHKNTISKDYVLFRLVLSADKKYINFKHSKFSIGEISALYNLRIKRIPVNNIDSNDSYMNYKEKLYNTGEMILYDELIMNLSNCREDIFKLSYTSPGYYVSERLKNAIEENGFTGMAFQEIEEMDKRIKVIY